MIATTNLALIIDRTSTPIQLHHWFDLTGHIWEPSPSPIPRQARSVIYWGGEMAPLAFKIEVPRSKRYRSQTWRLDIHRVFAMMNGNPPYLQRNISHDTFPDLPRMLPRHIMPMRHLRLFRCSDALKYRWNWWWAQQGWRMDSHWRDHHRNQLTWAMYVAPCFPEHRYTIVSFSFELSLFLLRGCSHYHQVDCSRFETDNAV